MNLKTILFFSIILLIFSTASISAADLDDIQVNETSDDAPLTVDDTVLKTDDCENAISDIGEHDSTIDVKDSKINSAPGTFNDLQNEVYRAPAKSVVDLTKDYNGAAKAKIQINKDLTIDGHGHIIDCLGKDNCIAFYSTSGTITLKNLIIKNGHSSGKGGAICCMDSARYIIDNCTFINNYAQDYGGAIYSESDLIISRSVFSGNTAEGGGAVYAGKKTVYVDNSTFYKNYAAGSGGAIYSKYVNVNSNQIESGPYSSFFINNTARAYSGGAISTKTDGGVYDAYIVAINTVFSGNGAELNGGAIYNYWSTPVNVTHCLFDSNTAYLYHGGAIHSPILNVDNCSFFNNWADENGGAISTQSLIINQTSSYFVNNYASRGKGGAIYTDKFEEDVKYAVFIGNKAAEDAWISDDGGAIYINKENHITFSQCAFINNHCTDEGGAIYLDSRNSHLTLVNNIFRGNKADDEGQDVFNCGYYDKIRNNWWGENNPSSSNDRLIEWKSIGSNVHHSDCDPLKMYLAFLTYFCDVNESITGQIGFKTSNDEYFIGELWGLDAFDLISDSDFKFKKLGTNIHSVSFEFTPEKEAVYTLTADLYGKSASTKIYVVNATIIAPEISTAQGVPATLKIHIEGNKSLVSNEEVQVIFNSKTYKAVTDENGDASIVLNDVNTPGDYEIIIWSMGRFGISAIHVN